MIFWSSTYVLSLCALCYRISITASCWMLEVSDFSVLLMRAIRRIGINLLLICATKVYIVDVSLLFWCCGVTTEHWVRYILLLTIAVFLKNSLVKCWDLTIPENTGSGMSKKIRHISYMICWGTLNVSLCACLFFANFNEILYVARGQWLIPSDVPCDPIQAWVSWGLLKFAILSFSLSLFSAIFTCESSYCVRPS